MSRMEEGPHRPPRRSAGRAGQPARRPAERRGRPARRNPGRGDDSARHAAPAPHGAGRGRARPTKRSAHEARSERATPQDALARATAIHLSGHRVDMGTLARDLGVGRATLYRWFGSRERLMEEVLLGRAETFVALARESARGSGDERLMSIIRAMIGASAAAQPVRWFIEREPTLALRILAGEHGRLHRYLVEQALADLKDGRDDIDPRALRDRVDATIQLVTALLWVAVAVGDEPPVGRIEGLARELLAEHPARRGRRGRG